jgi:hypothetical protein
MEPESEDTHKIINFIQNSSLRTTVAPLKFSDKSRFFLSQLINVCKTEFQRSNMKRLPHTNPESRFIDAEYPFPKSTSYSTVPKEIDLIINHHNKYLHKASVAIHERTYNFNIILFPKRKSIQVLQKEAELIVDQACLWLKFGTKYAPQHCSNVVDVFFYMTDHKKLLPKLSHDHIDMAHVNTAFTTSCASNTEITLFRKEEWFKVFIHESFHNLGLDFSHCVEPAAAANARILAAFPINSDIKLYESYCEMWAEIVNVMIRAIIKHPRTGTENMIAHIERDLQYERVYSLFQMAKLMNHFGINYSDLYQVSAKRNQYREKTAAFSYFVIKSLLMYNVDAFMEWCLANNSVSKNDGIIGSFAFKNPDANCVKYAQDMVIAKFKRPEYVETVDNVESSFFSPRMRIQNTKFIYENMRMSVFG